MVDYIADNFATWAKYYNRSIGEGWTRFAERIVGINDNGYVVYKNTESAQVEDDGEVARDLYAYDNSFGGIVFGDTGVPTRISSQEWYTLQMYDGGTARTIPSYAGSLSDSDIMYYSSGSTEWVVGPVEDVIDYDALDDLYVNVTGGDSMEAPFDVLYSSLSRFFVSTTGGVTIRDGLDVTYGGVTITSGGLEVTAGGALITAGGLTVSASGAEIYDGISLYTGSLSVAAGNITYGNNYIFRSRNYANTDYVEIAQVSTANKIIIGDLSYRIQLKADSSDNLIQYYHNSTTDDIAPFNGMDTWNDGYIPIWYAAGNHFIEADPDALGWVWDRTLDANEYIKGHDGTSDRNLIGVRTTPTIDAVFGGTSINTAILGASKIEITATDDVNITWGSDANDELTLAGYKIVSESAILQFETANTGVQWYLGGDYIKGLFCDGSDVITLGDPTESSSIRIRTAGEIRLGDNNTKIQVHDTSTGYHDAVYCDTSNNIIFGETGAAAVIINGTVTKIRGPGYTGTSSPSTTQWPTSTAWGIHVETDVAKVYLVYNYSGTIYKVELT